MYQVSRSLYRHLAPSVVGDPETEQGRRNRQLLLDACEANARRLALDADYFARPARTLFRDVRHLFPLSNLAVVWQVIVAHTQLASQLSEELRWGQARPCPAFTRKGTPCQREPRPGARFCPSHSHLESDWAALPEQPQPALVAAS